MVSPTWGSGCRQQGLCPLCPLLVSLRELSLYVALRRLTRPCLHPPPAPQANDGFGFQLLGSVVSDLPPEAYSQYLPTVWGLLFTRLQVRRQRPVGVGVGTAHSVGAPVYAPAGAAAGGACVFACLCLCVCVCQAVQLRAWSGGTRPRARMHALRARAHASADSTPPLHTHRNRAPRGSPTALASSCLFLLSLRARPPWWPAWTRCSRASLAWWRSRRGAQALATALALHARALCASRFLAPRMGARRRRTALRPSQTPAPACPPGVAPQLGGHRGRRRGEAAHRGRLQGAHRVPRGLRQPAAVAGDPRRARRAAAGCAARAGWGGLGFSESVWPRRQRRVRAPAC